LLNQAALFFDRHPRASAALGKQEPGGRAAA